jgi:hypothetical protein
MSLIKSADVPKHMADRLRSRRIAARLAASGGKKVVAPVEDRDGETPAAPAEVPTT